MSTSQPTTGNLLPVELKLIKASTTNPRKHFDEVQLKELAASIAKHGVLQAILVRPLKNGYELVAGERRFGQRTKQCHKLGKATCGAVRPIYLRFLYGATNIDSVLVRVDGRVQTILEMNLLAISEGFDSWEDFALGFLQIKHKSLQKYDGGLRYTGFLHEWKDFIAQSTVTFHPAHLPGHDEPTNS